MATIKNPYPRCSRDQFPMVQIGDRQQCVVEYLDRRIGQKQIVDAYEDEGITYYVFENGYELPLLCFCCAKPLVIDDIDKLRQDMKGRRLKSMSVETVEASDGDDFIEFSLEFSPKGIELDNKLQPIAPEAAARMKLAAKEEVRQKQSSKKKNRTRTKKGFG